MFEKLNKITFPKYVGNINVNMMPFIFGDKSSLPEYLHSYLPLIKQCFKLEKGKHAYLTINESFVPSNTSQRRQGIHTEGTSAGGWGGGQWGGGIKGIYMASTDGSCNVWNTTVSADKVNEHGSLIVEPIISPQKMEENTLYWLTDRTPHEALPVEKDINRQFFRLVSDEVSFWWEQHSTPNPLGIKPNCKILTHSKF